MPWTFTRIPIGTCSSYHIKLSSPPYSSGSDGPYLMTWQRFCWPDRTRIVVNEGLAHVIAAAMSKRRTSAEKAARAVAEPENPRCPKCDSRTVYAIDHRGVNRECFYCEAECGWQVSLGKTEQRGNFRSNQHSQSDLPKDGPPCPTCGAATKLIQGRYGPFYGCVEYPHCRGTVNPDRSAPTSTWSSRRFSGIKGGN